MCACVCACKVKLNLDLFVKQIASMGVAREQVCSRSAARCEHKSFIGVQHVFIQSSNSYRLNFLKNACLKFACLPFLQFVHTLSTYTYVISLLYQCRDIYMQLQYVWMATAQGFGGGIQYHWDRHDLHLAKACNLQKRSSSHK